MKFSDYHYLFTEGFEEDKQLAKQFGFDFIDKEEVGNFEVSIFKHQGMGFYQLGLNRKGFGFMTDQMDDNVPVDRSIFKSFREIDAIINRWKDQYTDLKMLIGSNVEKKTHIYHKMFKRYSKLNVGSVSDMMGMSYFEISR